MAKLTVGSQMPDFTFVTPFEAGWTMLETAGRVKGRTAVVFLRYFGCPLCQYDMHEYAVAYDSIAETNGQLLVVLQSDPEKLSRELAANTFPFEIVCDPEQRLYHALEIGPAKSTDALVDDQTAEKIKEVERSGLQHGDYEGEELQLPAAFIVTPDLTVVYAHYGTAAGDVPTPSELTALLR